jgi:hypothetical protein
MEWLDGTRYVHLLPSMDLPDVAEWAKRCLELRIEERTFRPERRVQTGAGAGELDE